MILLDIMDKVQKIAQIGLSTEEKQSRLNVSEVWYAWDILSMKYDIIETTNIILNLAKDGDMKLLLKKLLGFYENVAREMEKILVEYAVPLPPRPPEGSFSTLRIEIFTDKDLFDMMMEIVQTLIPLNAMAVVNSTSPMVKKRFKKILTDNLENLDSILEYGKLKNYVQQPPLYRV